VNILSHQNINLHSKSTDGGLVHINAGQKKRVPDDVADHPALNLLIKSGVVVVLKASRNLPLAEALKKSSLQPELEVPTNLPKAGTVVVDSKGKPIGVSDGKRIVPIDLEQEPVSDTGEVTEDDPDAEVLNPDDERTDPEPEPESKPKITKSSKKG
jgi:hypothetical protein